MREKCETKYPEWKPGENYDKKGGNDTALCCRIETYEEKVNWNQNTRRGGRDTVMTRMRGGNRERKSGESSPNPVLWL